MPKVADEDVPDIKTGLFRNTCHLVCLWPASFPGTLRPLGVSAPRICRVFAQKKVGIFDRWDMIG